jgi:hypothetical protein
MRVNQLVLSLALALYGMIFYGGVKLAVAIVD